MISSCKKGLNELIFLWVANPSHFDDDLTALVTDFGIARLVKGGDESANVKETISIYSTNGLLCGSVGYIAPGKYFSAKAGSLELYIITFSSCDYVLVL